MFRTFYAVMGFLVLVFLFAGCVQHRVPLAPQTSHINKHDINDVDVSDLDEDISAESETVIAEEGREAEVTEERRVARIAFPASEYNALPRRGRGTVKGKIYVTDLYGEPVVGAGTRLYLNPVTSYSEQWYEESYLGGAKMQKADPRLFNYLRFTAANSDGEFAFYGVPDGDYYLIGTVKCAQQCGFADEKSIRIAKTVSVHGKQVVKVDLTGDVE